MKISVCIEAETIEEYAQAIQALATGYTVAPVIKEEPMTKRKVESDAEKQKAKVNSRFSKMEADKIEGGVDIPKEPKEEKQASVSKTEEKTEPTKAEAPEQSETETKGDEKLQTSKYGFAAVKLQAGKLNKIPDGKADLKFLLEKFGVKKLSELTEDQYDAFHNEVCDAIDAHDKAPAKEEAPKEENNVADVPSDDTKAVTLEMIRGKAKELAVAGYKQGIQALLKEFGAAALTKIPKDKYDEFYKALGGIQ